MALSLLSTLQPALGVAFAFNVAYIGLPRFRYRSRIREYVSGRLIDGETSLPKDCLEKSWYKHLLWLSGLPDKDKDDTTMKNGYDRPGETWAWFYKVWYSRNLDKWWVSIVTALISALIFIGSAQEFDYLAIFQSLFTKSFIHWWFWAIFFLSVVPSLNVWVGNWIVRSAKEYADRLIEDHTVGMVTPAAEVKFQLSLKPNKTTPGQD
ncbi:MAG: hypothetical protein GXP05_09700 [Alphaproteobacteria bacterium]|nr:hypothetical protein [Alphaproteobacteria bacterium]